MTGIHLSALNALGELNRGNLEPAGEVITTIYPKFYRDPLLGPYLNDAQRFIEDRGVHGVSYNDSGTAKFAQCIYLYLLLQRVQSPILLNVLKEKGDFWSLNQAHEQWAILYDPIYVAPQQTIVLDKGTDELFQEVKKFLKDNDNLVASSTFGVEQLLGQIKEKYQDYFVDEEFMLLLKDLYSSASFSDYLEDAEFHTKFQELVTKLERIHDNSLFTTVRERALAKGAKKEDIHQYVDQLLAEGKIAPADAKNYKGIDDPINLVNLQKILRAL